MNCLVIIDVQKGLLVDDATSTIPHKIKELVASNKFDFIVVASFIGFAIFENLTGRFQFCRLHLTDSWEVFIDIQHRSDFAWCWKYNIIDFFKVFIIHMDMIIFFKAIINRTIVI